MTKNEIFICDRCDSTDDVAVMYINDEPKKFCKDCRVEMFSRKKPVGRPKQGVTQKVSLTLPEEEWEWFDKKAKGNRSQFLKHLIWEAMSPEAEWSNYACLGYAIVGAMKLGYSEQQIQNLVKAIKSEFDFRTISQAEKIYIDSPY